MKSFEGLRDSFDQQRLADAETRGEEQTIGNYYAYTRQIEHERTRNHRTLVRRTVNLAKSSQLLHSVSPMLSGYNSLRRRYESPWFSVGKYDGASLEARLVRHDKTKLGSVVENLFETASADIDLRITDGVTTKERLTALRFDTTDNLVKTRDTDLPFKPVEYGSEIWGEVQRLASIIEYNLQTLDADILAQQSGMMEPWRKSYSS